VKPLATPPLVVWPAVAFPHVVVPVVAFPWVTLLVALVAGGLVSTWVAACFSRSALARRSALSFSISARMRARWAFCAALSLACSVMYFCRSGSVDEACLSAAILRACFVSLSSWISLCC